LLRRARQHRSLVEEGALAPVTKPGKRTFKLLRSNSWLSKNPRKVWMLTAGVAAVLGTRGPVTARGGRALWSRSKRSDHK